MASRVTRAEYKPAPHVAALSRVSIFDRVLVRVEAAYSNHGIRHGGAEMDRFGVFNLARANSKHCEVYLDDLTYTTAAEKPRE